MKPITAILETSSVNDIPRRLLSALRASDSVEKLLLLLPPGATTTSQGDLLLPYVPCRHSAHGSGDAMEATLGLLDTPFLLRLESSKNLEPEPTALHRMLETAASTRASIVYGDAVLQDHRGEIQAHPLPRYQEGSVGDEFPLGPMQLWSTTAIRQARMPLDLRRPGLRHHAWYDLRLALSRISLPVHLAESTCLLHRPEYRSTGQAVFDYLAAQPAARAESEQILTFHLQQLGARLLPPFRAFTSDKPFPREASVIIPVRNRLTTIADAVASALSQETPFDFNVIAVDNHSTDGTSQILQELAARHGRLLHLVPHRPGLGIGGCWNQAVFHRECGRYAVQLDSDDLYADSHTLERMVDLMRERQCGMAVGSYRTVDMDLNPVPPGEVLHDEWTDANGPNNALGVAGLGAPRAFATELLRSHPFPDVSYGEDYAVALRLSREYRVGRIFEPVYNCRRWQGNTDADLSPVQAKSHREFKDMLRTVEIRARRAIVSSCNMSDEQQ